MIVTRIVYSNGGHSMINRVNFRNGWSTGKRKSDVGPFGAGDVIIGTTSTFTFWREVVVVCVVILGFGADAGASCAANLNGGSNAFCNSTLLMVSIYISSIPIMGKLKVRSGSGITPNSFLLKWTVMYFCSAERSLSLHLYIPWNTLTVTHLKYSISNPHPTVYPMKRFFFFFTMNEHIKTNNNCKMWFQQATLIINAKSVDEYFRIVYKHSGDWISE